MSISGMGPDQAKELRALNQSIQKRKDQIKKEGEQRIQRVKDQQNNEVNRLQSNHEQRVRSMENESQRTIRELSNRHQEQLAKTQESQRTREQQVKQNQLEQLQQLEQNKATTLERRQELLQELQNQEQQIRNRSHSQMQQLQNDSQARMSEQEQNWQNRVREMDESMSQRVNQLRNSQQSEIYRIQTEQKRQVDELRSEQQAELDRLRAQHGRAKHDIMRSLEGVQDQASDQRGDTLAKAEAQINRIQSQAEAELNRKVLEHQQKMDALKSAQLDQLSQTRQRLAHQRLVESRNLAQAHSLRNAHEVEQLSTRENLFEEKMDNLSMEHRYAVENSKLKNQRILANLEQQQKVAVEHKQAEFAERLRQMHMTAQTNFQKAFESSEKSMDELKENLETQRQQVFSRYSQSLNLESKAQRDPFYRIHELQVDFKDLNDHIEFEVQVPEHEREHVRVRASRNRVDVTLARAFEASKEGESSTSRISNHQSIRRSFPLSTTIDPSKIEREEGSDRLIFRVPKA